MADCQECGTLLVGRQKKYCGESCKKQKHRRQHLWDNFRITMEDYDAILKEQGGVCGICGKSPGGDRHLPVDHEHENKQSGVVRGCLCFFCNKYIVGARSTDYIVKAAAYLTDPPARRALGRDVIAPGRPKSKRKRGPRKRRRG